MAQQDLGFSLASYIDHTILKAETSESQVLATLREALDFGFKGVCVNSCHLPLVARELKGSAVLPVSVIGFPLGAMSTEMKAAEAKWCVENGAKEIDMVLSVGHLKSKNFEYVKKDIAAVVRAADRATVKVILETALLSTEEKVTACKLSVEAGAHFVKTCTGFGGGGATLEDIALMRKTVGPNVGVKASGGIKNKEQALALIAAGATRLGTSSGVLLVQGEASKGGY